jgi:WD40 repeat protein
LISGGYDGIVMVWDMMTGICVMTLSDHTSKISSLVISPDNRIVVSGSDDKTIKIWSIVVVGAISGYESSVSPSDPLVRTIEVGSEVSSLSLLSDDSKVVVGGYNGYISIYDISSGISMRTMRDHIGSVSSLCVSHDDCYIISGGYGISSSDYAVKVWDIYKQSNIESLIGHSSEVSLLVLSSDKSKIISGYYDRVIKIWDMSSGQYLATINHHHNPMRSLYVTPSDIIISYCSDSDDDSV